MRSVLPLSAATGEILTGTEPGWTLAVQPACVGENGTPPVPRLVALQPVNVLPAGTATLHQAGLHTAGRHEPSSVLQKPSLSAERQHRCLDAHKALCLATAVHATRDSLGQDACCAVLPRSQ